MKKMWVLAILLLILSGVVLGKTLLVPAGANSNMYVSMGDFLLKQGYTDAAEKAYLRAIVLDSDNMFAYNNLGAFYREKNPILSEENYLKALKIDPEYAVARNNLALLYNSLGRYSEAAANLQMLADSQPENKQYVYDLAINLAKKFYYEGRSIADLNLALSAFKKAYSLDPSFGHSLENIKVLEEIRRMVE
ncbi:MAG: tetratricopeptide repeat protein [Nanoarchaeota archaeon]|nr:tetratricopeptide repeat protein [Nanoarchaeota archaeon]